MRAFCLWLSAERSQPRASMRSQAVSPHPRELSTRRSRPRAALTAKHAVVVDAEFFDQPLDSHRGALLTP